MAGAGVEEKKFNLLYEPWICVFKSDGMQTEISLLEVLRQADKIDRLAGELPTQDVAILRLLLAVLYGALVDDRVRTAKDAFQLWKQLWDAKAIPMDKVEPYLKQYEDRFWLFHPQTPFYQVAEYSKAQALYRKEHEITGSGEEKRKPVAKLVGDLSQSANKVSPRLFPGRTGVKQSELNYGEAARWLLHLNGFDDNAAKKPTPKVRGYLGQLGMIYAKGHNLFETLLLNFVLLDEHNKVVEDSRPDSKAYWEKPVCTTVENLIVQPAAIKDLYTLQSRRILLHHNESGKVDGYQLTMGDYFDPDLGMLQEPMTVWFRNRKTGAFQPKTHNPVKQVWREFNSLVSTNVDENNRDSGIVWWLRRLEEKGILPLKTLNICTVGLYYEFKSTLWMITDVVNDSLQLNSQLLAKLNENWIAEITEALARTDKAVAALAALARNVSRASTHRKQDNDSSFEKEASRKARADCYNVLDNMFREWLRNIDPETDSIRSKIEEWQDIVRTEVQAEGKLLARHCSDTALIGFISVSKESKGTVIEKRENLFTAYTWFEIALKKIFE